ncbi:MAG: biotin--[acetyl-CoA-carboxylase] ligase [Ardenticatenia bacterium]|nr:MAG: biotin--[acetyl-CoA-carboxylase] ligase [Ardenticatenia bacterium]
MTGYDLSAEVITAALMTRWVGRPTVFHRTTSSTQDELKRLAEQGATEGTLVIADEQLCGRGRMARKWIAPARSSLLFSILFRPTFLLPNRAQWVTMVCALAIADAVYEVTGLRPNLKWPNDVLLRDKKLAGILTEIEISQENKIAWVIVGMGLNVNVDFSQLPELSGTAISLSEAIGRPVARLPLLTSLLSHVERRYEALRAGHSPVSEWAAHLLPLGQEVTVVAPEGTFSGFAESVDETGALLLHLPDGRTISILVGDVTLRRKTSERENNGVK